jgi:primase-polymerase (primpol)-like protein
MGTAFVWKFICAAWSDSANWATSCFPGAAVEVSQSGKGLHIFGSGSAALDPDHGCRRAGFPVEIYTEGRLCALTGTLAAGDASLDFSAVLPQFLAHCGLPERVETLELEDGRDERFTGAHWDDDELVQRMCDMPQSIGTMFARKGHPKALWTADADALAKTSLAVGGRADGCPYDRSAADAALMYWLSFWTGRDLPRMARLFERSALYRPEKYQGKGAYRLGKVLRIGARNPMVYDRPNVVAQSAANIDPATHIPAPGVVTGSTMNIT